MFAEFVEINHKLILEKMYSSSPAKANSSSDAISNTTAIEVVRMEAPTTMPIVPRSPRLKHTPTKEAQPFKPK